VADQAQFQFAAAAGTVIDMSDGVITWRVAAVAPNAGTSVTLYAQDGAPQGYGGAYQFFALDPAAFPANTFRDISIDLRGLAAALGDAGVPDAGEAPEAADAGDAGAPVPPTVQNGLVNNVAVPFDKSQITQFGITLGVTAAFTGSTVVRVAVDQVTFSGIPGQTYHTFTTSAEGLAINTYQLPPLTPAPVHHP